MTNIFKKPYEISLWEDKLVFYKQKAAPVDDVFKEEDFKPGEYYYEEAGALKPAYEFSANTSYYKLIEGSLPTDSTETGVLFSYYEETKICNIGSNLMDSQFRALEPKLTQKINGENTLVFSVYYQLWDEVNQKLIYNPYLELLKNERKVKLRIGEGDKAEWFDFIIKNIQENSDTKKFTYTCKDQFINELSKSGFELVLDNELENNMGTINYLAENILKDSDWRVDTEKTEELKQYIEEPVYLALLNSKISVTPMLGGDDEDIASYSWVCFFYSEIAEQKKELQLLLLKNYKSNNKENQEIVDDNFVLLTSEYVPYLIKGVEYNDNKPNFVDNFKLADKLRGKRLVRQTQTKYDSRIDKYVGVYEDDEDQVLYGYTQSEYLSSGAILNYITNPSEFTSTSGWDTDAYKIDYSLSSTQDGNEYITKLVINRPNGSLVMNRGIGGNRSTIGSFKKGDKYIVRIKASPSPENIYVSKYNYDGEDHYQLENILTFTGEIDITSNSNSDFGIGSGNNRKQFYPNSLNKDKVSGKWDYKFDGTYNSDMQEGYTYFLATCGSDVSKTELNDWDSKFGVFLDFGNETEITIQDFQLFKYQTYEENGITRFCVPDGKLYSETKTKYIYYKKDPGYEIKSIEDLKPVYTGYAPNENYTQVYGNGEEDNKTSQFTKVRSISGKESNRFNLIQSLCETFQCWCRFYVERNNDGSIKYGKDVRKFSSDEIFRQQKFVYFKETIGKLNNAGFKYGVNTKSISRQVDSSAIVTKMIVKDNANEFAPNGFCSIARASENPTGENFLLNFDHYVRQGLLNLSVVTNDLYLDVGGYLGYYKILKRFNTDREKNIDIQSGLIKTISDYESAYTNYKMSHDSAKEEKLQVEMQTLRYLKEDSADGSFYDFVQLKLAGDYKDDDKLKNYLASWCQCQNVITQHGPLYEKAEANLKQAQNQYESITNYLKELAEKKRALGLQFYKKYSRFMQEGSWIKEDYVDPNLYYLDSHSTLNTSAIPKVSYTINVVDVSTLQHDNENFKYYDFKIGELTYVEDTEFFGWSLVNRKTPYKQEVVVSEIISELDAPEKNQIKVQNYKTQFEDLFQRIAASTQQAEYHTGEYNRAANMVEADGTIALDTLQNSFANNALKLSNAKDQSVVWDESGITATNLRNPSEMIRIISGGIFLSSDGGQTWKTGIGASGINTSYLTTGQINTNKIFIMNGNNPAFRWDEKGISAYFVGVGNSLNMNKFVRFDHNGIYGILANDNWTGDDEDIHNSASFALTWSGFSLKNNDGSVRISTGNDIQVLKEREDGVIDERIKIGRLNESGDICGIRIKNKIGQPVMETDSGGQLWLKNQLIVGDNVSTVTIGYLSGGYENSEGSQIHEVFNANDKFKVYEDGKMVAESAEVHGAVFAESGQIGNLTIQDIVTRDYETLITNIIDDGGNETLTAHLYYKGKEITEGLSYQWFENDKALGQTGQSLTIENTESEQSLTIENTESEIIIYSCKICI